MSCNLSERFCFLFLFLSIGYDACAIAHYLFHLKPRFTGRPVLVFVVFFCSVYSQYLFHLYVSSNFPLASVSALFYLGYAYHVITTVLYPWGVN